MSKTVFRRAVSGMFDDKRTLNVFSTIMSKFNLYRPAAASDGFVATRSFSDLARPGLQSTPGVGRVFRGVRGVTAFNGEPKSSAVATSEASTAPSTTSATRHVPPRPSVAINGFGRNGKCLLQLAIKNNVNVSLTFVPSNVLAKRRCWPARF